jgi:hypothetical protein
LLTQRSISPSTLNILGCCSESGEDGKQSLPTGYTEPDVGTADIKNKADTDFERWKNWGARAGRGVVVPFRELTTHGTPDEKRGAGKGNFSESNTEIRATERVKEGTTPG